MSTERKTWQCDCVPGSVAVRVCNGDRPECWGNGNGEAPDWLAEYERAVRVAALQEAADAADELRGNNTLTTHNSTGRWLRARAGAL